MFDAVREARRGVQYVLLVVGKASFVARIAPLARCRLRRDTEATRDSLGDADAVPRLVNSHIGKLAGRLRQVRVPLGRSNVPVPVGR